METFHLALPIDDLQRAREFYHGVLGLKECRSAINWIDYDFFGHQLSLHLVKERNIKLESTSIDGDQVPALHFGLVLAKQRWEELKELLKSKGQKFVLGPKIRFQGKPGEQGTLFVSDPSGNYLEFKYFTDTSKGVWY